jgi:sec-independent protein translocase protein TatB
MSFSDTIFLFFLALILFGPKKLPEIARQAGRLLAELRRASNEFRSQIESEIAHLEVEKNRNAAQAAISAGSLNPAPEQSVPRQTEPAILAEPAMSSSAPPSGGDLKDSAVADSAPPAATQASPEVSPVSPQESHV